MVAKNWQTKHGAIMACFLPQKRVVEIYEPVLLCILVTVPVEGEDEVTCMVLANQGVVLGFRSGKCILLNLETGLPIAVYETETEKPTSVTHIVCSPTELIVAHSQFSTTMLDGFPKMVMLPTTPIHCYSLESGKPVRTFRVPELTTQSLCYLSEWNAIVVFSAG